MTELRDAARVKADALWQRAEADPEFAAELAEELTSLGESRDYIIRPGEMTNPEKCETCGTLVTFVPEEHVKARGKREPALWESGLWRRHTPRRCGVMRRLAGG